MSALRNIVLDVTSKKGILAYAIIHEGKVIDSYAEDCKSPNQYENLITGYIKGVKSLISILENNLDYQGEVYIVSSNSSMVSWLNRGYALPKYLDKFNILRELIEHIPSSVEFICSSDCVSAQYATKSYRDIMSRKKYQNVSTIDDFLD